eukprot:4614942-Prymnesium_polylepis.2
MAPLAHPSLEEHSVECQLEYPRDELTLTFVGVLRTAAPALIAVHPLAKSTDANSNARPVALTAAAASKHKLGAGLGIVVHFFKKFREKSPKKPES